MRAGVVAGLLRRRKRSPRADAGGGHSSSSLRPPRPCASRPAPAAVIQTIPDILLLGTTEIGGLVLDVCLVALAAIKALVLKAVYFVAVILEKLFGWFPSVEASLNERFLATLAMLGEDALKWGIAILMYRPFESLAALLLTTSKLLIQFAMEVVEYACAAIYAAPAVVGFLLIPAVYVALAVCRRSRRIVVEEPPLTYSVQEFEGKVAQLQQLVVPPLPIAEATAEKQIGELMARVNSELQPLTVPPLPVAELAALNAAAEARARAEVAGSKKTVVNINTSTVVDARSKKSSTTTTTTNVLKVQEETGKYDGFEVRRGPAPGPLARCRRSSAKRQTPGGAARSSHAAPVRAPVSLSQAVRQAANSFRSTVSNLPTIADVAMTAEERLSAEKALLAAQQALQAAESAFYASPEGQAALSGKVTSTTTTSTSTEQQQQSSSASSVVGGPGKAGPAQIGGVNWGAPAPKPQQSKGPTRMPPPQATATAAFAVTARSPEEQRAAAAAPSAAASRPAVADAETAAKQFKACRAAIPRHCTPCPHSRSANRPCHP